MSNELSAGMETVVREDIAEAVGRAGKRGASRQDLSAALSARWAPQEIDRGLRELLADGTVVEVSGRLCSLRHTGLDVGSVQALERGDALIRSGAGGEVGYFVKRRNLRSAVDGDTVLLRRVKGKKRKSVSRLPEAVVDRVLDRRHRRLVGTLDTDGHRRWLVPFDPKVNLDVEVEAGEDLLEDQYVVVEMLFPVEAGRGPLRGRVTEVLGSPKTPGVDVKVVLRHFEIPEAFPPSVVAESDSLPEDPMTTEISDRQDLRGLTLITIDGESARDFDDAISVERLAKGEYRLGVHIADVAAYVKEGSALDREAYRRGTSVYYPDRAVPMLPEKLSNGLCSLRPGVPRLALSVLLTLHSDGIVRKRAFAETVICSARRMTYDEVRRLLEEPQAEDRAEYGDEVLDLLANGRKLMRTLLARRLERGSIDFDLPEGDVILDQEGFTVGVRPEQRTVAHRLIEEFMIAANEAVAQELSGHEIPALFRIHESPSPTDLEELRLVLSGLGIALKSDLESLHPSVLQDLLRRVEGKPEEPFVASMVLRSMQRAIYHPECRGHYALSSRHYLHFTSPIRRYPDLWVHRQLKALLRHEEPVEPVKDSRLRALSAIAEHCSWTERRAEQSERVLLQWKLVRFLAERVGETFLGRITGVHPFGFFVQLEDYFVDGLVPIRSLDDDFYLYEPDSHQLVGRSNRRRFRLADQIEVLLSGVDLSRRGLELRLPD